MADIVALGEVLADVLLRAEDKLYMEGNAGGAPANCLSAAAKLGASCAVIAKVGDDAVGKWLRDVIAAQGIDVTHLQLSGKRPTTLAMVSLDATGDRSFRFYRSGCADVDLRAEELPFELIADARIFHFGSVSMTQEPARSATVAAARYAKEHGVLVSFDPNLRPNLWESLEDAKRQIALGLQLADIVKISDDELEFMTGTADIARGIKLLQGMTNAKLLCVTCGANGCLCYSGGIAAAHPGYRVSAVDTTGAGDAFDGAMLRLLLQRGHVGRFTAAELQQLAAFANAAGALAATKYGAIASMPSIDEIFALMDEQ